MCKIISICVELDGFCKVGCPYCLLEKPEKYTSLKEMKDTLNILINYGVIRFGFSGADPLLNKDIYDLGKHIRTQNRVSLLRTSLPIPVDIVKCKESFDLVDVSIDSLDENIMKKCKPFIKLTTIEENIKKIVKANIRCRCNILLTQLNISNIEDTIQKLYILGIREIRIQKLVNRGKAKKIYQSIVVPNVELDKKIREIFALCQKLSIDVEELQSVNQLTLCILKPSGNLFLAYPDGIKLVGNIIDENTLKIISDTIGTRQKEIYGSRKNKIINY